MLVSCFVAQHPNLGMPFIVQNGMLYWLGQDIDFAKNYNLLKYRQ
jgi:hypothetical protein